MIDTPDYPAGTGAALLRSWGAPPGFYFIHLFTGEDGRSHIETINPSQAQEKLPYFFRARATAISLLTFPAGHEFSWGLTRDIPRLLVQLRGLCVTIVDDGCEPGVSYHPLRPGSVMLAEDRSGRGHRGKVFGDEDVVTLQVDLVPE